MWLPGMLMSRSRQTKRRIRDCKDLRVGTCEPNLRAGTRAPVLGRRQTERTIRDYKDLIKGSGKPNVRTGASASMDRVRALGSQWPDKGPVGARGQRRGKGRRRSRERSEGAKM